MIQRSWRSNFKNHAVSALDTIKSTIQRFNKTGSVASLPPLRAEASQKREDAKNQLKEMFLANPSLSIRKAFANKGISYGMMQSIFKEDLHIKSYRESVDSTVQRSCF